MFANKVVLITGGSAGIGAVTAECFAEEGASIAIVGRNDIRLQNIAQRCEKLGANVLTIKADITKDDETKTIVEQTIAKFAKLDVLVNNAGIYRCGYILDSDMLEIYDEIMNTNLRSVVHVTHLAIPYLKETKGNVINVSSIGAFKAMARMSCSIISKAAMDLFTKSAALELAPFGVRVNSVNPGVVKTDIGKTSKCTPELMEHIYNVAMLTERVAETDEVADLILYVASDKAKSITGSSSVIDNGGILK